MFSHQQNPKHGLVLVLDLNAEYDCDNPAESRNTHVSDHTTNLELQSISDFVRYEFLFSEDATHIYCVVSIDEAEALAWAQQNHIQLETNPFFAVQKARSGGSKLADATRLGHSPKRVQIGRSNYNKFPLSLWEHIHVEYAETAWNPIYKRLPNGELLPNVLKLQILHDILTKDKKKGGAGLKIQPHIADPANPLVACFALNNKWDLDALWSDIEAYPLFRVCQFWTDDVDTIREYFGEQVAFYFAFSAYFTIMMVPMAILGSAWIAVKYSTELPIAHFVGSLGTIFGGLTWAVLFNRWWSQRQAELCFKWGMLGRGDSKVVRSQFQGSVRIDAVDGSVTMEHPNTPRVPWLFCFFTLLTGAFAAGQFYCLKMVMGFLYYYAGISELSVCGFTLLFAIQIHISNAIFGEVSRVLVNWENCRYQHQHANSLRIKRVVFSLMNYISTAVIVILDGTKLSPRHAQLYILLLFIWSVILIPKYDEWVQKRCQCINLQRDRRSRPEDVQIEFDEKAKLIQDIEFQMFSDPEPALVEAIPTIVVQFSFTFMFILLYPLMAVLVVLYNIFEMRWKTNQLLRSRRGVPKASSGIGVYNNIIYYLNHFFVFTNMAMVCYRTTTVSAIVGEEWLNEFFFVSCIVVFAYVFALNVIVPDVSFRVEHAIERQKTVGPFLTDNSEKMQNAIEWEN